MNILVTGSNGQLGSEIKELAGDFKQYQFFFTGREKLDISDPSAIKVFVAENKINCIINCAAYTAVDKAESEPELADKINHLAVKQLAEVAKNNQISFIHISTDYVFNGKGHRPYQVNHPTNPLNIYGQTKLAGEKAIRKINPKNSLIIRTSWVYSSYGENFVKTMLRLGSERKELNVINDQIGAPTYARDLAVFILKKALNYKNEEVEIFHFCNEGVCSWYDFAQEVITLSNTDCIVKPISSEEFPTIANRPFFSKLDVAGLKKNFDFDIPYWKTSLKSALGMKNFF